MIYILRHAREFLGEFINGGTCDNDVIDARIDEVQRRLMISADWKHLVRRVRFFTCKKQLTLPPCFDKVIAVNFERRAGHVFNKYYEFLDGGPLNITCNDTGAKDLVDLGSTHPTERDIPEDICVDGVSTTVGPLKIFAMSTDAADTDKEVYVRGSTTNGEEIFTNGLPGMTVPINRWLSGTDGRMDQIGNISMSAQQVNVIHSLTKEETTGYITLYAYNPDWTAGEDGIPMLYYLSKYAPYETSPGYRRYQIKGHDNCCGDCIVTLVKMAHVPVSHETDVLLIQSLDALKAMSKAIDLENEEKTAEAAAKEIIANRILAQQLSDDETEEAQINVQMHGFAPGDDYNMV